MEHLPGYDNWKCASPYDSDYWECEICGRHISEDDVREIRRHNYPEQVCPDCHENWTLDHEFENEKQESEFVDKNRKGVNR